jgi:hypothetical protein
LADSGVWIIIPRYPNTRIYTTVLAATPSFTNAPDSDSKIIYAFPDVVHLGDDDYGQGCWSKSPVIISVPIDKIVDGNNTVSIYAEEADLRESARLTGSFPASSFVRFDGESTFPPICR